MLGGVAYIAASIRAPGIIAHVGSMARLRVGAFDDVLTRSRASAFVDACTRAGVDAELPPDIRRALWEKFVFLGALSGLPALHGSRSASFAATPSFARRSRRRCAKRSPWRVRKASCSPDDFIARQLRALDGLPAEMRSSMLGDLVAGHRLEAPWLCGRVAQLASQAGIAAPVNATIYAGLKPYVDGRRHRRITGRGVNACDC